MHHASKHSSITAASLKKSDSNQDFESQPNFPHHQQQQVASQESGKRFNMKGMMQHLAGSDDTSDECGTEEDEQEE